MESELSHIFVELADESLREAIIGRLTQQGVTVTAERTRRDENGALWLILSAPLPDVSQIVLSLLESGLSGNVQSINAKK